MKTNTNAVGLNLKPANIKHKSSLKSVVQNAHTQAYDDTCSYFGRYGINNHSVDKFLLGAGEFNGRCGFTVPIFDRDGEVAYIKLLRTPNDEAADVVAEVMGEENPIPKFATYPADVEALLVGEDQLIRSTSSSVLICENELERIVAIQEGVKMPIVTSGGGVDTFTFKDKWIGMLQNMRDIYVCMNSNSIGQSNAENLTRRLAELIPTASIYRVLFPIKDGARISLTDYFVKKLGTVNELFSEYAEFCCGAEPIKPSQFKELTVEDIAGVLDLTIKHDFVSKVITFLVMLLAYTESDQQNVMFNADSATGKTYICKEVSKYFPPQDVKEYGKTTPTAFFYSDRLMKNDEETGQPFIDLERCIMIFTEQPDTQLQENLRSLLSHDSKRIPFNITNKNKSGKNVAMEGYILGYPSTFFCSANMRIDEQEQTRCLILSPESSPEKIMAGIDTSIAKNSHRDAYDAQIENNEDRRQLMERVLYIKSLGISTIDIDDSDYLKSRFMESSGALSPKMQRDISHFASIVKAMTLVNAPFRMKDGRLSATRSDIDEAMKLWIPLTESMLYGVSPQLLNFYKSYILPAYYTKNIGNMSKAVGVTYDEIGREFHRKTGRLLNMENLRKQYIPALRTAALISCDKDENDKRKNIVTPLVFFKDGVDK